MRKLILNDPKLDLALSEKKLSEEKLKDTTHTCAYDYANHTFDSTSYVIINGQTREFISAASLANSRAEIYKSLIIELRSVFEAIKAAVADDPVRLNAFITSKCDSAIDMTSGVL